MGSDGLVCDLLWSDPEDHQTGWREMDKGVSYTYGPDVVDEFLKKNHLDPTKGEICEMLRNVAYC